MTLQIIEDNEKYFKYLITNTHGQQFTFIYLLNTTTEDIQNLPEIEEDEREFKFYITNKRKLSDIEKKQEINKSLKFIKCNEATEKIINIIKDETTNDTHKMEALKTLEKEIKKNKEKENERAELHLLQIINDNKTLFKFRLGNTIFTHNNKDGRRLTEEEKNEIIKEKLFIMMTLKHGLIKIK